MLIINARFLTQNISGVQRYAIEISKQIKKLNPSVRFVSPKNILDKDLAENLGVEIFGKLKGHLWEQTELPLYLKKNGNPLLLNLCNIAPILYKNKVLVLHDVAFERFPKSFSWKFRLFYQMAIPILVKTSKKIVTVSEFSKKEISEIYGYDSNLISVIWNAVSDEFNPFKSQINEKYILAVSSLNFQKNFHSLIKAFNLLGGDVKLYLIGAINKNFADHKLLYEIESNPNIIFLGRVSDLDLIKYYSSALVFAYPSLYEGFGIPPLEAQACGCPVLVSNAASLPEVCGDSALYCDPKNIDDMVEKMKVMLENDVLRKHFVVEGFKNIARFSWETSAKKILKVVGDL